MSEKFRKILFLTFVIAFVVITFFVMVYASGYSISWSWPLDRNMLFQKTGMFILDTNPSGARIFIDGKAQQQFLSTMGLSKNTNMIRTPAKIKNLRPGEYTIRLELENYWTWEKRLTINSGESTYAENVELFTIDKPQLILASSFQELEISPRKKYLALLNDKNFLNLKTEKIIKTPISELENISTIRWSPDEKIIFSNAMLCGLNETDETIDLEKLIGSGIENLKIDEDNMNRLLYQSGDSIDCFDTSRNTIEHIISGENYRDYLIRNNYIYLVYINDNIAQLRSYSLENKSITKVINLPPSSKYRFMDLDNGYLNLYDYKFHTLYIVNPETSVAVEKIIKNIKQIHWVDDDRILYSNDYEIWLTGLLTTPDTLITRISDKITNVIWHPSNNFIIYSTDRYINTIEMDEREKRNFTRIAEMDQISKPYLDSSGKTLYFSAKIGDEEGLYKLLIQ